VTAHRWEGRENLSKGGRGLFTGARLRSSEMKSPAHYQVPGYVSSVNQYDGGEAITQGMLISKNGRERGIFREGSGQKGKISSNMGPVCRRLNSW